jgi:hypothetical protein
MGFCFNIRPVRLSFPLVGNPSDSPLEKGDKGGCFEERFRSSRNDKIEDLKCLLGFIRIDSIKFYVVFVRDAACHNGSRRL